jgi:hypothetical protein
MKKSSCGSKMTATPGKKSMKPAMASKTMYNKKTKK